MRLLLFSLHSQPHFYLFLFFPFIFFLFPPSLFLLSLSLSPYPWQLWCFPSDVSHTSLEVSVYSIQHFLSLNNLLSIHLILHTHAHTNVHTHLFLLPTMPTSITTRFFHLPLTPIPTIQSPTVVFRSHTTLVLLVRYNTLWTLVVVVMNESQSPATTILIQEHI